MANYIDRLPDDAVKIHGAKDYIDRRGNVYGVESRNNNPNSGRFFIRAQKPVYGYMYCNINYGNGKHISKRVHRLVAEAFIPNPDKLPIVMHIDNNKSNNDIENLKWGTFSENTQQAVDDGLLVNDSGADDSQSIMVDQYDSVTNKLIGIYGSAGEAERITGVCIGTILFQCRSQSDNLRKATYFTFHGAGPRKHDIVVAYDMDDNEVGRFANSRYAEEHFGVTHVADMIHKGKPRWSKSGYWFDRITI